MPTARKPPRPATETADLRSLFDKVTASIDLSYLLALVGEEIAATKAFEGYAVNLLDEDRDNLVCQRIRLPGKHQPMERTLLRYNFPINLPDANNDCFFTGQPVVVHQAQLHEHPDTTVQRFRLWELSSLAVIPLAVAGDMIGTVMLFRQQGDIDDAVLPALVARLALYAPQIRNAVEYGRLRDKEARFLTQQKEHESFRSFVGKINSLTSEDMVYELISHEFLRRFSFDIAAVLMKEKDELVIKKCTDVSGTHLQVIERWQAYAAQSAYKIDITDGASASAFIRNSHLHFHDVMEVLHLPMSPKDKAVLDILKTPRTFLCMPIRRDNVPIGILWLWSLEEPVELDEGDVRTIEQLCSFISTAIYNARLYSRINQQNIEIEGLNLQLQMRNEQLSELAVKDRLTGLYNFGYFQEEIARRIQAYQRLDGRDPLALVMIDIDHFKQFNDTHGHQAGNQALIDLANHIRQLARQIDVSCRYGGEEFVVILPNCNLEGARLFAERLRSAVETTPVEVYKTGQVSLTISAGCAEHLPDSNAMGLVERADIALYQAKETGRNRVMVFGGP